jgi:ATP-dependent DNA helicase RecG
MSVQSPLHSLLAAGMGSELHWFPDDVTVTQLAVTMAGMANANGGTVIIGIATASGEIVGIRSSEDMRDRIFQAALKTDPVLILPMPQIQEVDGTKLLQVSVPQGLPHVFSVDGRYWVRRDVHTELLSPRRLRQLLLERGVIQFESRLPSEAVLGDIDFIKVEKYLQTVHLTGVESPEEVLLRRGCLRRLDGQLKPTFAGLMLFGRVPQQWVPQAVLLLARFQGISFSDQFIRQEVSGTLPEQLRQAEAFIRTNLRSVVRLVNFTRQETLEYPFEAVRELIVNAVAHRDYNIQGDMIHLLIFADRLEIHSPGVLPGPVNLTNLLQARFSRNPIITQVLSDLGYVERLGYGLDRVVSVMQEQGLRPPRFEENAGVFRVTLLGDQPLNLGDNSAMEHPEFSGIELNHRQKLAVSFLLKQRRITSAEYQEMCPDVHPETLRRDFSDLVARGLLVKIGDKKATYYILKVST